MSRRYFGTDGIRGLANRHPMTSEMALKVGMAAGRFFMRANGQKDGHRHRVVIAKDTRLSGYMIEPALTAGFISVGMDVILVGPMPTPAVAMLTRSLRADLGVMISASHNPHQDNGIKLFGPDGFKLSDDAEREIETLMADAGKGLASPETLGRAKRLDDAPGRYIEFAKSTFPKHLSLEGLKIVVDCAHGAAYHIAPVVFWELGADVIPIGVKPDGFNINQGCGSTDTALLVEEVKKHKADLGIALDGDADRVVICDEKGALLDGDQLLAMIATYWQGKGLLKGGGVVATDMSNLGFERYLQSQTLNLVRAKVGDRYVVEQMREGGFNVGGEQSGHIILTDYSTTGDGIVAALQALAMMVEQKKRLSKAGHLFDALPQILKNVRFTGASPLEQKDVLAAISKAEKELAGKGRLFIRPSGTEPLIRVMVEGENEMQVAKIVNEIYETVQKAMIR